jgi:hypothetical protein
MKKNSFGFLIVLVFTSFMVLVSCGKSNPPDSASEVPDSALTDSIPASGENEFQQDVVPQGRTEQLDSTRDSVDRKP